MNLNVNGKNILKCFTNKDGCCKPTSGGIGEWLFPNGSTVRRMDFGDDFYRNRDMGVLNLNWKQNVMIPTGMFCCEVPNPDQNACIGVYPEDMGNY